MTADVLGKVIEELSAEKGGIALLDEVDTLLHPLKSEVNFPVGRCVPLVLSSRLVISHPGCFLLHPTLWLLEHRKIALDLSPQRYLLPLHLLEPIFVCQRLSSGSISLDPLESQLLEKLRRVFDSGVAQNSLQSSPHLLLLSHTWYFRDAKLLFGEWLLLWLMEQPSLVRDLHQAGHSSKGLCQLDECKATDRLRDFCVGSADLTRLSLDALALVFICDPHPLPSPSLRQTVQERFSPTSIKLLNLSRDWLSLFLPHVLSKVNCVNYGLLSPSYIASHAARHAGRKIPPSRNLLAVPFVGKDVPSATSEFACPEVLIGLTILSYRYQGVRESDLRSIVLALKRKLLQEQGPMHSRPSRVLFSDWLKDAQQLQAEMTGRAGHVQAVEILPLELFQVSSYSLLSPVAFLTQRRSRTQLRWRHSYPLRGSSLTSSITISPVMSFPTLYSTKTPRSPPQALT